jgi:hypothetical protein
MMIICMGIHRNAQGLGIIGLHTKYQRDIEFFAKREKILRVVTHLFIVPSNCISEFKKEWIFC